MDVCGERDHVGSFTEPFDCDETVETERSIDCEGDRGNCSHRL